MNEEEKIEREIELEDIYHNADECRLCFRKIIGDEYEEMLGIPSITTELIVNGNGLRDIMIHPAYLPYDMVCEKCFEEVGDQAWIVFTEKITAMLDAFSVALKNSHKKLKEEQNE